MKIVDKVMAFLILLLSPAVMTCPLWIPAICVMDGCPVHEAVPLGLWMLPFLLFWIPTVLFALETMGYKLVK